MKQILLSLILATTLGFKTFAADTPVTVVIPDGEGQVVTGGDGDPNLSDRAREWETVHDRAGPEVGKSPLDAGGTGSARGKAERVERSGGAERGERWR